MSTTTAHGFDDMMKQLGIRGGQQSTKTHRLPPFTLIDATTLIGHCSAPLRSRFRQVRQLSPFTVAELTTILTTAGVRIGFAVPDEVATAVACRSRGSARIAINHLMWYRDVVQGDGGGPTMELLQQAFDRKSIDPHGMTHGDREYLRRLIEVDEPVGVGTLAAALGESVETLEESVEPFLLREGLISRTPRGRVATEKARTLFETEPPTTTMENPK